MPDIIYFCCIHTFNRYKRIALCYVSTSLYVCTLSDGLSQRKNYISEAFRKLYNLRSDRIGFLRLRPWEKP